MKPSLRPGLSHRLSFEVPASKTVRSLYPESAPFQAMPEVFATGFMVGLMEWACMEAIAPHLDPGEGSLGVHIDVSHTAATPPGLTVTVDAECIDVKGRRAAFHVRAHDGIETIGEGRHARFIVDWDRFNAATAAKSAAAAAARV